MAATFIDTGQCMPVELGGSQGRAAEILNGHLCGAKNVVATLHWLAAGERFNVRAEPLTHHLFYVMNGVGVFTLEDKQYRVSEGSGIYLGPGDAAGIRLAGSAQVKLFHLVVPEATH